MQTRCRECNHSWKPAYKILIKTGSPRCSDTKPSDSDGYCVLLRLFIAIKMLLNHVEFVGRCWKIVSLCNFWCLLYCTRRSGRYMVILLQFAISLSLRYLKQLLRPIQITLAWRAPLPAIDSLAKEFRGVLVSSTTGSISSLLSSETRRQRKPSLRCRVDTRIIRGSWTPTKLWKVHSKTRNDARLNKRNCRFSFTPWEATKPQYLRLELSPW